MDIGTVRLTEMQGFYVEIIGKLWNIATPKGKLMTNLNTMEKRQTDLKEALNKPKPIDGILTEQIDVAMHEHNRSSQDLFLSAISAGLDIGFRWSSSYVETINDNE
jgi:hypothetical protein